MNEKLKKLYQTVILKNNHEPFHFEKRESAEISLEAYNQFCGDRYKLYFDLKEGKISNLSFHGFGCAVSKASTSILIQNIEGKTAKEAREILNEFYQVVSPDNATPESTKEDFLAFSAAKEFYGRMKCATLSWDELKFFLDTKQNSLP